METKESTTALFEKIFKEQKNETENNDLYNSLKTANDLYNKLIEAGIAKKRGYTLRGIEDSHLFYTKLNS